MLLAEGDATEEIVTAPGRVYLLCVTSFDRLPRGCAKRFAKVVRRAAEEGQRVCYFFLQCKSGSPNRRSDRG